MTVWERPHGKSDQHSVWIWQESSLLLPRVHLSFVSIRNTCQTKILIRGTRAGQNKHILYTVKTNGRIDYLFIELGVNMLCFDIICMYCDRRVLPYSPASCQGNMFSKYTSIRGKTCEGSVGAACIWLFLFVMPLNNQNTCCCPKDF